MFKNVRGKNQKSKLTSVDIPTSWPSIDQLDDPQIPLTGPKVWDHANKSFRTLIFPDKITTYNTARNRRHFGQAQGTQFTVAPLADLITWQADTDTAEPILQGAYTNDELDDITQLLLKHCQAVSTPGAVKPELTLSDFTAKLRVWRESTSTSPSGRHLGHYKVVCRPIAYACKPHDQEFMEDARHMLLQAHLDIINYGLLHGYSLQRWQQVVNVMILKEPDNHKIHGLRVLHLFEADYNLILGVKWRQFMKHAEEQNTLNEGQYGSRAGREATALIFWKR
jgi:hypothetical protein